MSRIYKVEHAIEGHPSTLATFLVDANSPAQALNFVARKFTKAVIAKPREIALLMKAGAEVESATEEKAGE